MLLFRSGWGLKKASGERDEVQVVRGGESEEEEAARFAIEEDQGVTICGFRSLNDAARLSP